MDCITIYPSTLGVVLVAAGSSSRMNGIDKQFSLIDGIPVLVHSIRKFSCHKSTTQIVVVCRSEQIGAVEKLVKDYQLDKISAVVAGGNTRQQSVFAGAHALVGSCDFIAIHDGARPLVTAKVIDDCLRTAMNFGSATAMVPVKDTIKVVENLAVTKTLDRSALYITQTPQIFSSNLYKKAMTHAIESGLDFTDDCQLIESLDFTVHVSQGSYRNIKITTPEDLSFAEIHMGGSYEL